MAKARIMVVDDESVVRIDIREMVLDAGYDVVAEAANGEAAVAQAMLTRPDLIIMDVKMPKMDGLTASRIIYRQAQIPVLVLTAYSQAQLIDEAKAAGIIGYLVKPVTEADLVPGIEMALAQAARLRSLAQSVGLLEQRLANRKIVEQAKGILMQQLCLSEADAYRQMRSHCMNHGIKMEHVARQVLAQGHMPE